MFAGILYGLEATLVFCLPTRSRIRKTGKGNLILALELLPSVLMQNDILLVEAGHIHLKSRNGTGPYAMAS